MTDHPIRIIIADDHTVVREGLAAILGAQNDMELVGVATDGLEAVDLTTKFKPDVILMDMVMPRMDGLTAIQTIKAAYPEAHILVLTSFADDERVFPAIKAGAMGYLLKDTPREELIQAVRNVAQGFISLHPSIARRIIREINQPVESPTQPAITLTEREMETLRLIARGMSNQEMASSMGIHENTVAKYVSAVLSKLQLANRTQAALYAIRMGLVDQQADE
ncbi:MAG: response regulator transcription factor [Anaerolineae bacterium]|nr:response regulator transcription factor [Anaerolineae bacterium]